MVRLVPMTESDFQDYRKRSVEEYAREHVRAGDWDAAEAPQKAEKEFLRLLPEGVNSINQYLYSIEDEQTGVKVGMIWFAVRGKTPPLAAFIYDFLIYEQYRKRGYGGQTLRAVDEKAKELGIEMIGLHVFGHNQAAITLYQKAGYEITDLQMEKKLGV